MSVQYYYLISFDMDTRILIWNHMMDGDRRLLSRLFKGDEKAWKRFVLDYSSFIYAVVNRYTNDYDEKMSTYLYILERIKENDFYRIRQFGFRSSLSTWLTVVARNLTLDFLRSQYGRDFRFKPHYVSLNDNNGAISTLIHYDTPEKSFQTEEIKVKWGKLIEEIKTVFSRLEDREVLLLKLVYLNQVKINEAGRLLQIHSVYKFLEKTLNKVRSELQKQTSFSNSEWDIFLKESWRE